MNNNDDYYEGGGDSSTTTDTQNQSSQDEGAESETFLLNKSVCPGMAVGDEGKFRVVKEMEGEYLCEYVDSEKGESDTSESTPPASNSDSEMQSYMS